MKIRLFTLLFCCYSIVLSAVGAEIKLTTDREFYLAGEYILADLFMVNRDEQAIEAGEVPFILDLVSSDGKVIERIRKIAYQGMAGCIIELPSDLKTDYYRLYAYPESADGKPVSLFLQKMIKIIGKEFNATPTHALPPFLFPEGGQMIAGLANNCLLYLPEEVHSKEKLYLLDRKDTLAEISPQTSFLPVTITPDRNSSYSLAYLGKEDPLKIELAKEISPDGVIMKIEEKKGGFYCNIEGNDPEILDQLVLTMVKYDTIIKPRELNTSNGLFLDKTHFKDGLNYLMVSDHNNNLLAGRAIYIAQELSTYDFACELPEVVSTRELLTAEFQISKPDAEPVTSYLSATIWEQNFSLTPKEIMLKAILSGHLSEDMTMELTTEQCKQVVMTLPIDLQTDQKVNFNPILELVGQTQPQNKVSFSCPDCRPVFQVSTSDQEGFFRFEFQDFKGIQKGFFKNWTNAENMVSFENRQQTRYPEIPENPIWLLKPEFSYLENYHKLLKIKSSFKSALQNKILYETPQDRGLAVDYDDLYILKDYLQFPLMEDVMREIVLGTIVRDKKKGYKIRVLNRRTKYYFKEDPLILLDGLPISSDQLMDLNPNDLEAVAVSRPPNNFFDFGSLGENGVILVVSRHRNVHRELNLNLNEMEIHGTSQEKELEFPVSHEQSSHHQPDFRSLLYHQLIKRSSGTNSIQFYTSDKNSTYQLKIKGFTSTGLPFYFQQPFFISLEN